MNWIEEDSDNLDAEQILSSNMCFLFFCLVWDEQTTCLDPLVVVWS